MAHRLLMELQRKMTPHTAFEQSESEIRLQLQGLVFRTKNIRIVRVITALIGHFDGLERCTELEDGPARYLFQQLAPIERRRAIQYDDVAKVITDMPALYYRCTTAIETWSPLRMSFRDFHRHCIAVGERWHCFMAPVPICDGRELAAFLLQKQ